MCLGLHIRIFSWALMFLMLMTLPGCSLGSVSVAKSSTHMRTVGRAMVREAPSHTSIAAYTQGGAGAITEDGQLIQTLPRSARQAKKKDLLDACGLPRTGALKPDEDFAADEKALARLLSQQRNQLTLARKTFYQANSPKLKNASQLMVTTDQQEMERLLRLQAQLCRDARLSASRH
jgi:hypothetical protein